MPICFVQSFILLLFVVWCSVTADVKPEDVKNDVPQSNITEGKDEVFCQAKKHDTAPDCAEDTQSDVSSQKLMDCEFSGGLDESVIGSSESNSAQTHISNGQKSRRSTSAGPHPVASLPPNPDLILCLSSSPKKGVNTPSDVEMLSPDSPIGKAMLVNNYSDKDLDGSTCAEDSSNMTAQVTDSQQFVSDSGCSTKDRDHVVAIGTEDADMAECSGSSDMSQDLTGRQSGAIFGRYSTCQHVPFTALPFSCIDYGLSVLSSHNTSMLTMSFNNTVLY